MMTMSLAILKNQKIYITKIVIRLRDFGFMSGSPCLCCALYLGLVPFSSFCVIWCYHLWIK